MKVCYHPGYQASLSAGHPYPMSKYPLLKGILVSEGIIAPTDIVEPAPLPLAAVRRVHTADYIDRLVADTLSDRDIRRLGLPWSQALWQRSLLAAGGTLLAARLALTEGLAGNLAGGTHHAFADHGEGFCVINDVAIAIRQLQAESVIRRAVVIDLDVHQGNGTAAIFADDASVFTFSMHGERNYPLTKTQSTRDVGLADGVGDHEYLSALQLHLPGVLDRARADIAFYVAGVDVAAADRYGRLKLSDEGIAARDRTVVGALRHLNLPACLVLAGGYAPSPARTAELHAHAFREAVACEQADPRAIRV